MKHGNTDTKLQVIARSPFHIYYEGPAEALSAKNRIGEFDILPGHADFFSMLTPCQVTIDTDLEADDKQPPVSFNITNGILTVRNNQVMLFANM